MKTGELLPYHITSEKCNILMQQVQLKLKVLVHRIKLQVRFPCSLTAALKVDSDEVPLGQQVPLRMGEAHLEHSASHTFSLFYDSLRSQFAEKRLSIVVYLKSSSGRIPAGAAFISINSLRTTMTRSTLPIEKCPDKYATVEASLGFEIMSKIEFQPSTELIRDTFSPLSMQEPLSFRQGLSREKSRSRNGLSDNSSTFGKDSALRISGMKMQGQKIRELERERLQTQQELKELKEELNGSAVKQSSMMESQRIDRGSPSPAVTEMNIRSKGHELERQLKAVQKKCEQMSIDLKTSNSKREILQRSLKQAEGQVKLYRQKSEDAQQLHESYIKRAEFKESTTRDQIRSLTEKLAASEAEKQRMIFEKNDLVTEFEEREKSLRAGLRDKERLFQQEKNKLQKKIDQLSLLTTDSQTITDQLNAKLNQITAQLQAETSKAQQAETRKQQLIIDLEKAREEVLLEKRKREDAEERFEANLQEQDDKKKLRRKIADLEQEIARQTKNNAQLDANSQRNLKRAQEAEVSLKEKLSAIKVLQRQSQTMNKQLDNLRKAVEERDRKLQQAGQYRQRDGEKLQSLLEEIKAVDRKWQEEMRSARKEIKDRDNLVKNQSDQISNLQDIVNTTQRKIIELEGQISLISHKAAQLQTDKQRQTGSRQQLQQLSKRLEKELNDMINQSEMNKIQAQKQIAANQSTINSLEQQIAQLQSNYHALEEESNYQHTDLTRRLKEAEIEVVNQNANRLKLQDQIENLKNDKVRVEGNRQDLQYSLKLKHNQIKFLKESLEKANQQISQNNSQNKQLNLQLEQLNQSHNHLISQHEELQRSYLQTQSNGNQTQQQLQNFKANNRKWIQSFVNKLTGKIIEDVQNHEQSEITQLVQAAVLSYNLIIKDQEANVKRLTEELAKSQSLHQAATDSLEQAERALQHLEQELEEERLKHGQLNGQAQKNESQLRKEIQGLLNKVSQLQDQLRSLGQIKKSLQEEIQAVNHSSQQKSQQINGLLQQIQNLETSIAKLESDYLNNSSSQSGKHQAQVAALQKTIEDLKNKLNQANEKIQEWTNKTNETTRDFKKYQTQSQKTSKAQSIEIDKLNKQIQQKNKEIQAKNTSITRYSEIEHTLRESLLKSNQELAGLKETSEIIKKRSEKGSAREKQLEEVIEALKKNSTALNTKQSQLEKLLKEKANELMSSRQGIFRLEKEKAALQQDLDISNATIKVKEDTQKKMEANIKSLQGDLNNLTNQAKNNQKGAGDREAAMKKEIGLLQEMKSKLQIQVADAKAKIEGLETRLSIESKSKEQNGQKLSQQLKEWKAKSAQLQAKIEGLNNTIKQKEGKHALEEKYLKPLRDNIAEVKCHMAEYAHVGDQFESNKNKLLKMATNKLEQYNDKNMGQRVKEISYAYQRLKASLLTTTTLSEQQKLAFVEQFKKVQSVIDKVLRGQR